MPPATSPLWTEYVSAFAAVVGVTVAFVALIIARRSARSASASATSAEQTAQSAAESATASTAVAQAADQQLAVAREEQRRLEAERARKPRVSEITPSEVESRPGQEAPARMIRIGFTNHGDRTLEDGLLTILLDPGSAPEITDRWGRNSQEVPADETIERWPGPKGIPRAFVYFAQPLRIPAGVSIVRYVRVARHGRFAIRVKLFSAELDNGGPWVDAMVVVDEAGNARIDDLSHEGLFSGQDSDFAAAEVGP